MSNALQEQLLKAGLASKQKVRDVKTQKKRNRKAKVVDDNAEKLKAQIAQQKQEQAAKDKALNEQRFAQATEKGLVRGLITEVKRQAVSIPNQAEIKFNYTLDNKVYGVYLDETLQTQLLAGRLGIVRLEEKSYLVPHSLAARVNLLVPEWCGYLWEKTDNEASQTTEDDPYADYVIPDDLMW